MGVARMVGGDRKVYGKRKEKGHGRPRRRRALERTERGDVLNLCVTTLTVGGLFESVEKLPVSLKYKNLFDYRIHSLDYPINFHDCPVNLLDYPINLLDYPINLLDYPLNLLDYPINFLDCPINLLDYPIN